MMMAMASPRVNDSNDDPAPTTAAAQWSTSTTTRTMGRDHHKMRTRV